MRVLESAVAPEIASWAGNAKRLTAFNASEFESQHADLHLCVVSDVGDAEARCSLWWNRVPARPQHRVGAIGHYASASDEAARLLLGAAEERLRAAGCTIAIGPMNGNTWRSYRFVVEAGDHPPFFMEPMNPPQWPRQFGKAGFSPLAWYFSALNSDLSRPDPRLDAMERKMADAGVVIRSAASDLRGELAGIYAVSRVSFRNNFLYTEIPEAEFLAMYEPVLPVARPELVLIAERGAECVGYLFAIPDLAESARGDAVETFIIKTVSILPDPELRGLGSLLVARAQQIGHRMQFRRCIHALMFEDNTSLKISRHYAAVMRKYALYFKDLAT